MSRIPPIPMRKKPRSSARSLERCPDNPEATDQELAESRPFAEVCPELAESIRRGRGRPPKADAKQAVTLRLDPETVERFKREGPDWRARMERGARSVRRGAEGRRGRAPSPCRPTRRRARCAPALTSRAPRKFTYMLCACDVHAMYIEQNAINP